MSKHKYLLGERMEKLRIKKGLKLTDLAVRATEYFGTQVNFSILMQWECGSALPSIVEAWWLADVLGCSIDYLAGRSDKEVFQ